MIDTHCHLDFYSDQELPTKIQSALQSGIQACISVGCDIERSKRCIEIAKNYQCIYPTCGIHPNSWEFITDENLQILEKLISERKEVVGIGESGLDYYQIERIPGWKEQEVHIKRYQKKGLDFQGYLSKKYNKPLIIHNRDSSQDILKFLDREEYSKVVLHCFSEHEEFLEKVLSNEKVYFSFAGNITYKSMEHIEKCIRRIPLTRIMLETDSPFLIPKDIQSKQNEPQYILKVVEKISKTLNLEQEFIISSTTQNAINFWNLY